MASKTPERWLDEQEAVAGNGLLHRRMFLSGGAALATALVGLRIERFRGCRPAADRTLDETPTTEGFLSLRANVRNTRARFCAESPTRALA